MAAQNSGEKTKLLIANSLRKLMKKKSLDKIKILIYGIGSTTVKITSAFSLVWRQYRDSSLHPVKIPRLTVADVLVQSQRLILGKNPYGVYA